MIYIFYTMIVLIGVFFVSEIIDVFGKKRDWGENP